MTKPNESRSAEDRLRDIAFTYDARSSRAASLHEAADEIARLRDALKELAHSESVLDGTRVTHKDAPAELIARMDFATRALTPDTPRAAEAFDPHAHLPGEHDVGRLIREAAEYDKERGRFYLTCSIGELAQRICSQAARALADREPDTPRAALVERLKELAGRVFNGIPLYGPDEDGFWLCRRADVMAEIDRALSLPPTQEGKLETKESNERQTPQ